jgi:polysaccharide export outer membrane protein
MKRFLLLLLLLVLLAVAAPAAFSQAVMRRGDVFDLRLSGMPADAAQEFYLQYTVSDEGKVKIPYIGEMQAAGVSTTKLARSIEERLVSEKIFTRPTAVINLQQQSRFVTVGGEVRQPNVVQWSPDLTLSVAIKRVGGPGEWGSLKKIKITREGQSRIFNLKKADKDASQNPRLLPGDEIEVM